MIAGAFDLAAMAWVARRRRPILTKTFRVLSFMGEGRTWFAVAIVLLVLGRLGVQVVPAQHLFVRAMLCSLAAWALTTILKRLVRRTRPERSDEDVRVLGKTPRDTSFPSGHASSSAAFAIALLLIAHPVAPVVCVWAIAVAASRVYLGVHYPTDVLGGMLVGALTGTAVFLVR